MDWETLKSLHQEVLTGAGITLSARGFVTLCTESLSHTQSPWELEETNSAANIFGEKTAPSSTEIILFKLSVLPTFYDNCSVADEKHEEIRALMLEDDGPIDKLISLLGCDNQFVSFAATKCACAMMKTYDRVRDSTFMKRFFAVAITSSSSDKLLFNALDVCSNFLDSLNVPDCHSNQDVLPSTERSKAVIEHLHDVWDMITKRCQNVHLEMNTNVTFLLSYFTIWRTILQLVIDHRLPQKDFARTFFDFKPLFDLLGKSNDPIVWRHGISVLNKSVCFVKLTAGGTSSQIFADLSAESISKAMLEQGEPSEQGLLRRLPLRSGYVGFGGADILQCDGEEEESCHGDVNLLKKAVMLMLRCAAVLSSRQNTTDNDQCVEAALQLTLSHMTTTSVADWPVVLFEDQDDMLIESLLCLLAVTTNDDGWTSATQQNDISFRNPHCCFQRFLSTVSHDPSVLLDLLLSPETCFLVYLTRYLRFVIGDWNLFCNTLENIDPLNEIENCRVDQNIQNCESPGDIETSVLGPGTSLAEQNKSSLGNKAGYLCKLVNYSDSEEESSEQNSDDEINLDSLNDVLPNATDDNRDLHRKGERSSGSEASDCSSVEESVDESHMDRTMTVLIRLRISLEKMHDNNLCPFNAETLISLIESCEELYEVD